MSDLYTAQRNLAARHVELRKRIDESGDADLLALQEQHDFLWMSHEMGREIHSEWAAQARKIAPELPKGKTCDCDICAISRALDKAAGA